MATYISILRGINVSGQKLIRMEDLKSLYEGLGFRNVRTYIQSGNVIFNSDLNSPIPEISRKIAKAIEEKYFFLVPVIIRTAHEMNRIHSSNPFLKEAGIDNEKLHVTFLEEAPALADISALQNFNYPPDRFIINGKEIYLYCPGGYGNTKLSNTFFEKKLHVQATTRNWKTVGTLVSLASSV
jgi:uncharacterized protein (DUF1697 family)